MQRCSTILSLILFAIGFVPVFGHATTIHVPADYTTIQEAIDAAIGGDTVLVAPGTYVENIDFVGKAITVMSSDGPEETVLDGSGYGSVVVFQNDEGPDSVLDGFTITNGWGWLGKGGGVYCGSTSSPVISNNLIMDNWAHGGGGICCMENSSPAITNNIITCNQGIYGGGIYCGDVASPVILNNLISKNMAFGVIWPDGSGGGVYSWSSSYLTIANNIIAGNSSDYIGGIFAYGHLINNVIVYNRGCFGGVWADSSSTITNSILWGNDGGQIEGDPVVTYSNVQGGYPGTGNIDSDPLFVDPGHWDGICWVDGDYHLAIDSPCIDSGDNNAPNLPEFDFEGDPRIFDGDGDGNAVVDMGGDEFFGFFVPSQYATIQSAIDAVPEGATVLVAAGTYYENIDFKGKAITVFSASGAQSTVLDGGRKGSVVTFQNGEGPDSVLKGFQIVNGSGTQGGGVTCKGASPVLRNNYIHDNAAPMGDGGGIYCFQADPLLEDNQIASNSAGFNGGGIFIQEGDPLLEDNQITSNSAGADGGGIYCQLSSATIRLNQIDFNTADKGGGLYCFSADLLVEANDISFNSADQGGGGIHCQNAQPLLKDNYLSHNSSNLHGGGVGCVAAAPIMVNNVLFENTAYCGGGIYSDIDSAPVITNNTIYANSASGQGGGIWCINWDSVITNTIFWHNDAPEGPQIFGNSHGVPLVTYCLVEGGWLGDGNIDENPRLINPYAGDFHLSNDSPCINTGSIHAAQLPQTDFEGDPRILNVIVDMGADETDFSGGVNIRVPADYPTIQSAIDVALEDSTVLVSPGTYFENIDLLGKAITVKSSEGANVTVIDGSQAGSVVSLQNNEGLDTVLEGFRIVNGSAASGGGICCVGSSPTIRDNIIANDIATLNGGGIYCEEASPAIIYNLIEKNASDIGGGGIYFSGGSSPFVHGNLIKENASESGGGIYCGISVPTISNNLIAKNAAKEGGGICCIGTSYPTLTNNIIVENSSECGGGIYCDFNSSPKIINTSITTNCAIEGGGIYLRYASLTLSNAIVWGNETASGPELYIETVLPIDITFSDIGGGWSGTGNIDEEPLFVDPLNGDYHLSSPSPCINRGTDAGAPSKDFENDDRPFMGTTDMGADEYMGVHPLEADAFSISETTGGKVNFTLASGTYNGGRSYLVLGSLSGTAPGTLLPKGYAILRLNWDQFTSHVLGALNTPACAGFCGTLDGLGYASAQLNVPPVPGFAGTCMHYAYCLMHPFDFVSNPVSVEIVP